MSEQKCQHGETTSGAERPYITSVSVHPFTDENPRAHGWVTYTQTCDDCGAERAVNANQGHAEFSPWGPSTAERRRREREAALTAAEKVRADAVRRGTPMLHQRRVRVEEARDDSARIDADGCFVTVPVSEIARCASAPDGGDGVDVLRRAGVHQPPAGSDRAAFYVAMLDQCRARAGATQ